MTSYTGLISGSKTNCGAHSAKMQEQTYIRAVPVDAENLHSCPFNAIIYSAVLGCGIQSLIIRIDLPHIILDDDSHISGLIIQFKHVLYLVKRLIE